MPLAKPENRLHEPWLTKQQLADHLAASGRWICACSLRPCSGILNLVGETGFNWLRSADFGGPQKGFAIRAQAQRTRRGPAMHACCTSYAAGRSPTWRSARTFRCGPVIAKPEPPARESNLPSNNRCSVSSATRSQSVQSDPLARCWCVSPRSCYLLSLVAYRGSLRYAIERCRIATTRTVRSASASW